MQGGENPDVEVTGIAVDNGDVYVSGVRSDGSMFGTNACYWKNGNVNNVSRNSSFGNSWGATAFGIFLDGNDVYLAGYNAIANKFDIGCKIIDNFVKSGFVWNYFHFTNAFVSS